MMRTSWSSQKLTLFRRVFASSSDPTGLSGGRAEEERLVGVGVSADGVGAGLFRRKQGDASRGEVPGLPPPELVVSSEPLSEADTEAMELRFRQLLGYEPIGEGITGEDGADMVGGSLSLVS